MSFSILVAILSVLVSVGWADPQSTEEAAQIASMKNMADMQKAMSAKCALDIHTQSKIQELWLEIDARRANLEKLNWGRGVVSEQEKKCDTEPGKKDLREKIARLEDEIGRLKAQVRRRDERRQDQGNSPIVHKAGPNPLPLSVDAHP